MLLYAVSVLNVAQSSSEIPEGFMNNPVHTPEYCSGDKIEKNEMGGACSAYGGEERRIQGFSGET